MYINIMILNRIRPKIDPTEKKLKWFPNKEINDRKNVNYSTYTKRGKV